MGNLGKSFSKSKKGSTERRDKEVVFTRRTPQEKLFLPEEKIMKGKKSIFRSSFGGSSSGGQAALRQAISFALLYLLEV